MYCSIAGYRNSIDGVYGYQSTIHLHGEATAIHSNGRDGILAHTSTRVHIHLPSNHNTSFDNENEDRHSIAGGSIINVEE